VLFQLTSKEEVTQGGMAGAEASKRAADGIESVVGRRLASAFDSKFESLQTIPVRMPRGWSYTRGGLTLEGDRISRIEWHRR